MGRPTLVVLIFAAVTTSLPLSEQHSTNIADIPSRGENLLQMDAPPKPPSGANKKKVDDLMAKVKQDHEVVEAKKKEVHAAHTAAHAIMKKANGEKDAAQKGAAAAAKTAQEQGKKAAA